MDATQRARRRARQTRIRAVVQTTPVGTRYYRVYNLKNGHRYVVTQYDAGWVCYCEAAKAQTLCVHVQRVLDRERIRTKLLERIQQQHVQN
jgi:hypothetical protein